LVHIYNYSIIWVDFYLVLFSERIYLVVYDVVKIYSLVF